jgi:hypothetical protein
MINYDLPKSAPFDPTGNWTPEWAQWLTRSHRAILSVQQSGPTTDRPDQLLWVGRTYYDTTLGIPVWLHAINPIVWHDATGTPA